MFTDTPICPVSVTSIFNSSYTGKIFPLMLGYLFHEKGICFLGIVVAVSPSSFATSALIFIVPSDNNNIKHHLFFLVKQN